MIVIDDPNTFSQHQQGCVATIGKFDGVHLGHQLILDQLKQKAEALNLPALAIVIEPHPEEFLPLTPAPVRRVSRLSTKSSHLSKASVSTLCWF